MVKKMLIYLLPVITAFALYPEKNKTIAVIKSFEGNIQIENNGQILDPMVYLELKAGTVITLSESSCVTLFLYTGVKATFEDNFRIEITEWGLRGLDTETVEYLSQKEPDTIYSRKDTLLSRGFDPDVTDQIKEELKKIEAAVRDPLLLSLVKGDLFKSHNIKKPAREEFLKHKKLLDRQKAEN